VATTGTRLSAILAAAGGLLPSADSSGILIRLRPDLAPLDDKERELRAKMLEKDMAVSDFEVNRAQHSSQNGEVFVNLRSDRDSKTPPDPLLRDGDLVQVRRLVNALRIDGQVVNPGVLAYQPGLTLGDYIEQAGGATASAWHGHEQVTRAGSSQTQLARSVPLRPGDVVWVPTKPQGSWWERSGQLLFVLAQLATIALAVRSLR
jgi:protein involved in polysaccharide export with SLBB domain